jgi:formate/nitrite transporter FocA (FNT family)
MSSEPSFDALLPPEMAAKVEAVGVAKAGLPLTRMIPLGVLAGAFIGLGAHFSTVVTADTGLSPGIGRLLGGLVFSLGLILVVVSGAELFTGNTSRTSWVPRPPHCSSTPPDDSARETVAWEHAPWPSPRPNRA